jgi:Flp pilus assembly protein TadD
VEDHQRPLQELARLLALARAYNLMTEGDDAVAAGDVATARQRYAAAMELAPDNHEMVFWTAVTLASTGDVDEAMPLFRRAFRMHPPWRELLQRLPAAGLFPDDPALMNRILGRR